MKSTTKNKTASKTENENLGKVECLVIFKCNCRCIMCSTGLQIDRSLGSNDYRSHMPFADIIKDIDRAKKMNAKGVAFSGGEPNLRKDLPEIVKYAKSIGLGHIEVQSNGRIYYYKDYCQKLVDSGVTNFVISFHSHKEEVHDKIMGVPGTYKQVVAGIKNLNSLGKKVYLNIVLTKLNYSHLEEHTAWLLDNFDIQELRFTMVMLEGNVNEDPEGIVPRMSAVGPHICRAIDVVRGRANSFIYNMVPCLVPGHENYVNDLGQLDTLLIGPEFESSLDEERKGKKIKPDTCRECRFNKDCYGVWKKYADLYGLDELKPVKYTTLPN